MQRSRMPEDTPFILVVPACDDYTWLGHFSYIVDFIKDMAARHYVDDKRLCISGSSMGGYTCWMLAVMEPSLFSGVVICCGGGLYWAAGRITFPVRAIHGKLGPVVLPRESEIMAERINLSGGHCELILHDDLSHDVWTRTFSVVAHELLHLFGAEDFYATATRKALAQAIYPGDLMFCAQYDIRNNNIGDATAYYIGWTDTVPDVLYDEGW